MHYWEKYENTVWEDNLLLFVLMEKKGFILYACCCLYFLTCKSLFSYKIYNIAP